MEELEPSLIVSGIIKWYNTRKRLASSPNCQTQRSSIFTLRFKPKRKEKISSDKNFYTNVCSSIILYSQTKCSISMQWTIIWQLKGRKEGLIHATTWMNPGIISLGEREKGRKKASHKRSRIVWLHLFKMTRTGKYMERK